MCDSDCCDFNSKIDTFALHYDYLKLKERSEDLERRHRIYREQITMMNRKLERMKGKCARFRNIEHTFRATKYAETIFHEMCAEAGADFLFDAEHPDDQKQAALYVFSKYKMVPRENNV